MSVKAIGTYEFPSRDAAEVFGENQIVYFNWEQHMLFAAPFLLFVPRSTTFGELIEERVKPLLAPDPQAGDIEWDKVEWLNGEQRFTPDFSASLETNGIGHKDHIRMITPFASALFPNP